MHIVIYHQDELSIKIDGSFYNYNDPIDLANLLSKAYDAGVNKEGLIIDNQFNEPCWNF